MTRVLVLLLAGWTAAAADPGWPQFRGPNGSGIDTAAGYPVEFSPTKNVVWKKVVPFGQSSPVVAGGRVSVRSPFGPTKLREARASNRALALQKESAVHSRPSGLLERALPGEGRGIITALDPASGKLLKEGRSRDALGEYYASPIAADNKVFMASVEGKISVLKAGAQWEVLGVNDLAEETHATPALSNGRIYVLTRGQLYCFGK
jgi:hypothetical protein